MQKLNEFCQNHNVGLKILSLLLAVLSWSGIQKITRHQDTLKGIQIQVLHDEGVSVVGTKPREISATFRGTKADILPLDEDDIFAQIDLRGQVFVENQDVSLSEKMIIYAGNSRVVNISPGTVEVRLDKPFEKEVAVKAKISGYLDEGYSLDAVIATPEFVRLRGSKKLVNTIDTLQTKTIDLTGKGQSFEVDSEIVFPSDDWIGSIEPSSVLVQVSISETFSRKTIDDIPVKIVASLSGIQPNYSLDAEKVSITLRGDPSALEAQIKKGVTAYIIPAAQNQGSAKVQVSIADNIRLISINPPLVQWTVK